MNSIASSIKYYVLKLDVISIMAIFGVNFAFFRLFFVLVSVPPPGFLFQRGGWLENSPFSTLEKIFQNSHKPNPKKPLKTPLITNNPNNNQLQSNSDSCVRRLKPPTFNFNHQGGHI